MSSIRTIAACIDASERDLIDESLPTLCRYLNDPQFRAEMDAERAEVRDQCNAAIDAGMAKYRERKGIA
jgi:hypothetical protein